jgi:hypothetical protein
LNIEIFLKPASKSRAILFSFLLFFFFKLDISFLLCVNKMSELYNNLQGKESNRVKQLESDITFHIGKQEAELALKVNSAAYHGDLYQLKGLIRTGADPNKTDYDGRSPLV